MALPVLTYSDPEDAVIDAINLALIGRIETYLPSSVSVDIPSEPLAVGATDGFRIQVSYEAPAAGDRHTKEQAQVRVTCWASKRKRSDVKALASLVLGLLIAHPSDPVVGPIRRVLGRSAVATDPDTENLSCWFLVRVNLHATQLP